jgi:hypothetical protein
VEPEKNAQEKTVEELCKQAVAEQDVEKLLKLLIKLQQSRPHRPGTNPLAGWPEASSSPNLPTPDKRGFR